MKGLNLHYYYHSNLLLTTITQVGQINDVDSAGGTVGLLQFTHVIVGNAIAATDLFTTTGRKLQKSSEKNPVLCRMQSVFKTNAWISFNYHVLFCSYLVGKKPNIYRQMANNFFGWVGGLLAIMIGGLGAAWDPGFIRANPGFWQSRKHLFHSSWFY